MSEETPRLPLARRSFLSRMGAGAAAFGAAFGVVGAPAAEAQSAPTGGSWQPARHAEDDWFDQPSSKHRLFLDTTTAGALGQALRFSSNFFSANASGYGLTDADCAVIICARHQSTPFAFTDAMWAKYGAALSEHAVFTDPKTKQAATVNLYQASGYDALLTNKGMTLDTLMKRGLRLAVCALATRAIATAAARNEGGKVDDIFKELVDNKLANAHVVPAGIVAVNRAQERGYSFGYVTV